MASKKSRTRKARRGAPRRAVVSLEAHAQSMTALAADAIQRGGAASSGGRRHQGEEEEIPREGRLLRCGDPDESVLGAEYVGDDVPGGSTPTPDQNLVDEIGRAYGLTDEDSGALRTSSEILARRDKHRDELTSPKRPER